MSEARHSMDKQGSQHTYTEAHTWHKGSKEGYIVQKPNKVSKTVVTEYLYIIKCMKFTMLL